MSLAPGSFIRDAERVARFGRFMAVSVTTEPTFAFTDPVPLPRRFGLAPPASPRPYDVLPDGRIVAVSAAGEGAPGAGELRVVLGWFEELKAKVPVKRQRAAAVRCAP